tara:strand:- start:146 stop:361 length:216 start_codon:yes stop_codon:yes gene_type:complete
MFIELTESIQNNLYSNEGPKRKVSVNVSKITSFFPDKNETIIELRRKDSMRVDEKYEEVKNAIQEANQSNS